MGGLSLQYSECPCSILCNITAKYNSNICMRDTPVVNAPCELPQDYHRKQQQRATINGVPPGIVCTFKYKSKMHTMCGCVGVRECTGGCRRKARSARSYSSEGVVVGTHCPHPNGTGSSVSILTGASDDGGRPCRVMLCHMTDVSGNIGVSEKSLRCSPVGEKP